MPEGVFLNNKKYFSSKEAADYAGYTNDYVSRLCREKKVPGQMVGRVWYVESQPFLDFLLEQEQKKVEQSQALSEERKKTYQKTLESKELEELTSLRVPKINFSIPTPARELVEKSAAFTLAITLVFGTYLIKDTSYVHAMRENVASTIVSLDDIARETINGEAMRDLFSRERVASAAQSLHAVVDGFMNQGLDSYLSVINGAGEHVASASIALAELPGSLAEYSRQYSFSDIVAYSKGEVKKTFDDTTNAISQAPAQFKTSFARSVAETERFVHESKSSVAAVSIPELFNNISTGIRQGIISWLGIGGEEEIAVETPKEEVPQTVINQPVIERVVETQRVVYRDGVTESYVLDKLEQLNNKLASEIYRLSSANAANIVNNYHAISYTNKIDKLGNVTITNSTINDTAIGGSSSFSGTTGAFSGALSAASFTVNGGDTELGGGLTVDTSGFVYDSSTGNVGIGTTTPYAKLSVTGEVVANNFTATSTTATSTFSGGLLATRAPTLPHTFSSWITGNSETQLYNATLVINPASSVADGNLIAAGVGDNPKFLVDAEGDVYVNNLTSVGNTTVSTTTASTFTVEGDTTLGDAITDTTTINGTLVVAGQTSVSTVDGNFGVGTTSPWARLSVAGWSADTTTPLFTISSSTASATSTVVLVDALGNFGIGTTSPSANFAVEGDAYINGVITTDLTTSGTVDFSGTGTTTFGGDIEVQGLSAINYLEVPFVFATSTSATSTFAGGLAVEDSGLVYDYSTNRVGIGTNSPSSELEVVGDIVSKGTSWTARDSAADNNWFGVAYGNGRFVAVAASGTGNRVMTSPDGVNWTIRTSPADNVWQDVVYANGLFVAVASSGTGDRVMTSPDGINWTTQTNPVDNDWSSITYGDGKFVAVAYSGTGDRVMTSPDGINWTTRTSAADNDWLSVTYGDGKFVAVASSGTGDRVMTSPDGINWTTRSSAADNSWKGVTYGNGIFVAVSNTGTGDRVMTSPDGINWTTRSSAADNSWYRVTYGNGLFVTVAFSGSGNRVMTSPDGINWTTRTSPVDNAWRSVTYGNGRFVAVALSGTGDRVMTSGKIETSALAHNNIYQGGMSILSGNVGIGTTSPWGKLSIELDTTSPGFVVSNQGSSTPALYVSGVNDNGTVGIGTTGGSDRRLDVFDAGNPQLRLSQTSSIYTNFQVAASTGDLTIDLNPNTTAKNIYLTQTGGTTGANLRVCEGSACPSVTISNGGNVLVENGYYFGNGYKLDQVAGTTTEIAVYDTNAAAIIIFDEF